MYMYMYMYMYIHAHRHIQLQEFVCTYVCIMLHLEPPKDPGWSEKKNSEGKVVQAAAGQPFSWLFSDGLA